MPGRAGEWGVDRRGRVVDRVVAGGDLGRTRRIARSETRRRGGAIAAGTAGGAGDGRGGSQTTDRISQRGRCRVVGGKHGDDLPPGRGVYRTVQRPTDTGAGGVAGDAGARRESAGGVPQRGRASPPGGDAGRIAEVGQREGGATGRAADAVRGTIGTRIPPGATAVDRAG